MKYSFFSSYEEAIDPTNPFINAYKGPKGDIFYVEPGFYNALKEIEGNRDDKLEIILGKVNEAIARFGKIVLCADFEHPFIEKEGYVYKEITDFGDPLGIYLEDTNTPSNYGD